MTNEEVIDNVLKQQYVVPEARTWIVRKFTAHDDLVEITVTAHKVAVHEPSTVEFANIEIVDGVPTLQVMRILFNVEDVESVPALVKRGTILH